MNISRNFKPTSSANKSKHVLLKLISSVALYGLLSVVLLFSSGINYVFADTTDINDFPSQYEYDRTGDNLFIMENMLGAVHFNEGNDNYIMSYGDFNYTLDKITLTFASNNAEIETKIDGRNVKFNPTLQQSQIGFNASNTFLE